MKKGLLCMVNGRGGMIISVSKKQVVVMFDGGLKTTYPMEDAEKKILVYEDFTITQHINNMEAKALDRAMEKEKSCPTPEDVVRDAGAHIHREDDDSSCRPYLTEEDFKDMSTPFDTFQAFVDFLPLDEIKVIEYSSMLDYSFTKGFVLTSENIINKINGLEPEEMAEFMTDLIKRETNINPNRCVLFIDGNSNNSYVFMCDEQKDKPEVHDDALDLLRYIMPIDTFEKLKAGEEVTEPLDNFTKRLIDIVESENIFDSTTGEDFIKSDDGKCRVSLVEPKFIYGLGEVLTMGAKKYEVDNWKLMNPDDIYRYKDACLRHLLAYLSGEYYDTESGLPHIIHSAVNLMFIQYFEDLNRGED
jgi:hypothetical protein